MFTSGLLVLVKSNMYLISIDLQNKKCPLSPQDLEHHLLDFFDRDIALNSVLSLSHTPGDRFPYKDSVISTSAALTPLPSRLTLPVQCRLLQYRSDAFSRHTTPTSLMTRHISSIFLIFKVFLYFQFDHFQTCQTLKGISSRHIPEIRTRTSIF